MDDSADGGTANPGQPRVGRTSPSVEAGSAGRDVANRERLNRPAIEPAHDLRGPDGWAATIAQEANQAACVTIGLMGGSRQANDRRVIDLLSRALSDELKATHPDPRMLVVRLDTDSHASLAREQQFGREMPKSTSSPLGQWSDIEVPMPIGRAAPWTLEQLPRWLPKWKERYSVVLIDLGPMHLLPSRTIGRLCDGCFLLLGPDSCGSHEWILQHTAWQERCGTTVYGTLVTRLAAAA